MSISFCIAVIFASICLYPSVLNLDESFVESIIARFEFQIHEFIGGYDFSR